MKTEEQYLDEYIALMDKCLNRDKPNCYTEEHHILPKSWLPNDYLVTLTAKEHFIAHYLLLKAFPADAKMAAAFYMMCKMSKLHGRDYLVEAGIYAEAREAFAKTHAVTMRNPEIMEFYHADHGLVTCIKSELREKYSLPATAFNRMTNGVRASCWGWRMYSVVVEHWNKYGKEAPLEQMGKIDYTLYTFYHPEHGKVKTWRNNLVKTYGLEKATIGLMVKGKIKKHKGWILL